MAKSSTTFQKGQSGNPSGRSKAAREVQQAAQGYTEKSIKVLADLLESDSEKIRLEAAREMLDRGVGKPIQTLASDEDNPIFSGTVVILPDNGRNDRDQATTLPDAPAVESG
jgi:hypothetical protein